MPSRRAPSRRKARLAAGPFLNTFPGLARRRTIPGGYTLALDKKDWDAVRAFDWPGNVRQFLNLLKRAAYLGRPITELLEEERQFAEKDALRVKPDLLSLYCPDTMDQVAPAQEVYRAYLRHVFDLFEGNIARMSKALGIAPNTLRKHIDKN